MRTHLLIATALILSTSVAAHAGPSRGLSNRAAPATTYQAASQPSVVAPAYNTVQDSGGSIQTLGADGAPIQSDTASVQQPLESVALQPAATQPSPAISATQQTNAAQLQQQQAAQQQAAAQQQQMQMQKQQMMQQKMMQKKMMQQKKMQMMQAQQMRQQQMMMRKQQMMAQMTPMQRLGYKVHMAKQNMKMRLVGAIMGR